MKWIATGYSEAEHQALFGGKTARLLLGSGLETRLKFDQQTQKPITDQVDSQRAWLYYPGLGVQSLKLPADYKLPAGIEDMSEIELIKPEACIVRGNIYVRAIGIKSV